MWVTVSIRRTRKVKSQTELVLRCSLSHGDFFRGIVKAGGFFSVVGIREESFALIKMQMRVDQREDSLTCERDLRLCSLIGNFFDEINLWSDEHDRRNIRP